MSEYDPAALDPYYREAREYAREIVTLIKTAEEWSVEPNLAEREIRGQIRQQVSKWESEASPLRTWLLIEVLARSVAATYEDLADWSAAVIEAVANEDGAA